MSRRGLLLVCACAAIGAGAAVLALAGGDDSEPPAVTEGPVAKPEPSVPEHHDGQREPRTRRQAIHQAVHAAPAARLDADQRRAAAPVRHYVQALSAADGAAVCSLFVAGGLDGVDFPRERGDCAASVAASVGYADPRGFPVFRSAKLARVRDVLLQGDTARVTATVVTRFAGGRDPSIEDDVVYLHREPDGWLIVQPSVELYRAIGVGDPPPQALAPPG